MGIFGGPKWKREVVPDHKFDFVDTREFTDNGAGMRFKYLWLYIIVLKSFLVYVSDIFSAITMLTTQPWTIEIFEKCKQIDENCVVPKFEITKYLFLGCIIFSFLLLAYESRKAKIIIASRDISYAFTNVMANNYYSLRSYDHFCFFDHISNSTKISDDLAFFVFFTLKSWKRLLLADGPRQSINALTLYAIFVSRKDSPEAWYDPTRYFSNNSLSTSALIITTLFTVLVFAGSLLLLIIAAICYIPLVLHIRGNLKEYCCHKVDKRIDTVIKRRNQQRLKDASRLAQKEAMGDYSHLKNKKGEIVGKPLPQPTLPNVSVDDDTDDSASLATRVAPPSTYTQKDPYYYQSDAQAAEYPPMPAYHQQQYYGQYNPSQATLADDPYYAQGQGMYDYDDDAASTAHLATSAAPLAQQRSPIDRAGAASVSPLANPYSPNPQQGTASGGAYGGGAYDYDYDAGDVYQGRADPSARRRSPQNESTNGYVHDEYASAAPPSTQQQGAYGGGAYWQPPQELSRGAQSARGPAGRRYDEEGGGGYPRVV
ncbi:hypothetical protein HGRIS_009742 [Hohenbuehelia grisea]|uniref:Vacuole protein n=1 Tax=Hohenbuehelia grisea TaxID=104357 RepID=A0ABR3J3J3_9AGAR